MKRSPYLLSVVFALVFILETNNVGAQTNNKFCYTYKPTSGPTISVNLVTSNGQKQKIILPNQSTPSILQEIDFVSKDDSCSLLGHNFTRSLYLDFFIGIKSFALIGSPFELVPTNFDPNLDPALPGPIRYTYYSGPSDIDAGNAYTYSSGSDNVGTDVSIEDAIINDIDVSQKFTIKMSTEYGSVTLSTPATNCAMLSEGSKRSNNIVFMRDTSWKSNISDFLYQALALQKKIIEEKTVHGSESASFFIDLKKQSADFNDKSAGEDVSSCRFVYNGQENIYLYVVPPPVLSSVNNNEDIEPVSDKFIKILGTGFSPNGENVVELLDADSKKLLYLLDLKTKDFKGKKIPHNKYTLYTDFTYPVPMSENANNDTKDGKEDVLDAVPDGRYLLRVAATNSVWSNYLPVIVNSVPKPPTDLVAQVKKKGEIELNWKEGHPRGDIASYLVEKMVDGKFVQLPLISQEIEIGSTTIKNYPPSTTATFRVRAAYYVGGSFNPEGQANSENRSEYTNSVTITTLPKTRSPILTATAGPDNSIILSWLNLDKEGVKGYELTGYSSDGTADSPEDIGAQTFTYTIDDLKAGDKFCYTIVSVVNKNNKSDPSNKACATVGSYNEEASITSSDLISSITGADTISFPSIDKTISSVDLIVNGQKVASDTSAPWNFTFDSTRFQNGNGSAYVIINRPNVPPVATTPISITINNPVTKPQPTVTTTPVPTVSTNPISQTEPKPVRSYSCPSGYNLTSDNTSCYKPASTITAPASTVVATITGYTCVDGGTASLYMNNWRCWVKGTVNYYPAEPKYNCPTGATYIASRIKNGKVEKNVCDIPASNVVIPASNISPTITYSCPTGFTLKDDFCTKTKTSAKSASMPATNEVSNTENSNKKTSLLTSISRSIINITNDAIDRVNSIFSTTAKNQAISSPSPTLLPSPRTIPRGKTAPIKTLSSPKPSPVYSVKPTSKPSSSVSPRISPNIIVSPLPTISSSPKVSPIITITPSPSPTPTNSPNQLLPSPTTYFSPTPSPTIFTSPSSIPTPTPTPVISISTTPTPSPITSPTQTPTYSPTPRATPVNTSNQSPSPSPFSRIGNYSTASVFGIFEIFVKNLFTI